MINKKEILFRFKHAYEIAYNEKYFCCIGVKTIDVYDTQDGSHLTTIRGFPYPSCIQFLDEERFVAKNTSGEYRIYSAMTGELLKKFKAIRRSDAHVSDFALSPDRKYLIDAVYFFPHSKLLLLELDSGAYLLKDLGDARVPLIVFDADRSTFHIITHHPDPENVYTYALLLSLDYPFGNAEHINPSFVRKLNCRRIDTVDYLNGKLLLLESYSNMIIFDLYDGSSFTIPTGGGTRSLKWSGDGKYIARASTEAIELFDVEKRSCIQTYEVEYGSFADFYDNDSKLLIGTWKGGYCVDLTPVYDSLK